MLKEEHHVNHVSLIYKKKKKEEEEEEQVLRVYVSCEAKVFPQVNL